MFPAGSARG